MSINASPSHVGKRELRHEVFRAACWRHRLPLVFVNQIGGHDQLVYDGASFAIEPEPGVVFEARRFEEQVVTLGFEVDRGHFASLDGGALPPAATGLDTMAFYRRQIVLGLRDYARRCGFERVVVGASGVVSGFMGAAARFVFSPSGRISRQFAHLNRRLDVGEALANRSVVVFAGIWFLTNFLIGLGMFTPGGAGSVAWEAHIGGFLFGFLLFSLFDPRD